MKNTVLTLEGTQFVLELKGSLEVRSGTEIRTVRGHHYYDGEYEESYYYESFKGEARLTKLGKRKQNFSFTFSTSTVNYPEEKTLEQKVLAVEKGCLNKIVDQKLILDYLCRKILSSLKLQLKNKEKSMAHGLSFEFTETVLDKEGLIAAGALTTEKLQIQLALR